MAGARKLQGSLPIEGSVQPLCSTPHRDEAETERICASCFYFRGFALNPECRCALFCYCYAAAEIDRTLKRVDEGIAVFDEVCAATAVIEVTWLSLKFGGHTL